MDTNMNDVSNHAVVEERSAFAFLSDQIYEKTGRKTPTDMPCGLRTQSVADLMSEASWDCVYVFLYVLWN